MTEIKYIGKCLLMEGGAGEERGEEKGGKPKRRILVIGDLHLGYEESLNRAGVFVSRTMYEEIIRELDEVFVKTGNVDEVVLLGDVKHDFGGIMRQEWKDVLGLFEYLEGKMSGKGKIVIVKGNHDTILEPIVRRKENVELKNFYVFGEVCFLHGDKKIVEAERREIKYWIMGHGHPAVKISDGVKIEKYKCFLEGKFKRKKVIIVPSFGEYRAGSDPRENELGLAWDFNLGKFNVWVVGEDLEVLDFGRLGKMM